MTNAIAHRGPDDAGINSLKSVSGEVRGMLGNRRLAILDLSPAGHQPMFSADGRYCLTYNGEIYNFRELRDELIREGAEFRSSGDTQVILVGWARHGPDFLARLRGMFVLALWDRDEERCYLARDAFGIKPLYLAQADGEVLFASEVRSLLASGKIPRVLSSAAVGSYLATGSVAEPLTIIDGIRAVPAGTVISIDCRRGSNVVLEPHRFATPFLTSDVRRQTSDSLRDVLRDSVSHHLVSDVPVALFLSGGLDSSSVVAVASEVSTTKLDTFTVTFGEEEFSEAVPARLVAKKFGTNHHEIRIGGNDLLDSLPDAFAAMDQPSLDGSNTYTVSRAVRQNGIKVVLSGLGGDELFAGYPSFRRAERAKMVWPLRPLARPLSRGVSAAVGDPRIRRIKTLFDASSPARGAYEASRTLFDDRQIRSLMNPPPSYPRTTFDSEVSEQLTVLQQVSLLETTGYMRNTLLRDSDVFSMAHSLELRVPFVDREVARAAMTFPDSAKLRRGVSKPILVDAMRDVLPEPLLSRRKQGFTLPFEHWMRDELRSEIESALTSRALPEIGLSTRAVAEVWSAFLNGARWATWSRPWALYTLKRWADQNDVALVHSPKPEAPAELLAAAR